MSMLASAYFLSHILVFSDYSSFSVLFRALNLSIGLLILMWSRVPQKIFAVVFVLVAPILVHALLTLNIVGYLRGLHLLMGVLVSLVLARRFPRDAAKGMFIALSVLGVICLSSLVVPIGVEPWEQRVGRDLVQFSGAMQAPNYIAGLSLVFLCLLASRGFSAWFSGGVAFYLGFISRSRSFLILAPAIILSSIVYKKALRGPFIFALILVLALSLIFFASSSNFQIVTNLIFTADLRESPLGSRSGVFVAFWEIVSNPNFPLLGYGYGASEKVMESFAGYSYSFHSSLLNLIIDFGFIGFLIYSVVVFYAIYYEFRGGATTGGALVVLVGLSALTSVFEYSTALYGPFFWFFLFVAKYEKSLRG